ncbi:MAG: hypothetical protein GY822_05240 [Deltaproteobacteria bacterium]|nr:hypothetical protein [Deltaproteobacteria bacterium]
MREEDQERILTEVQSRVVQGVCDVSEHGGAPLDEVVADSIYHEMRRLKDAKDSKQKREDHVFYSGVRQRMQRASHETHADLVRQVAKRYSEEISGNFDERIYQAVTKAGAPAMGMLLNAVSPKRLMRRFPELPTVDEAIVVQGEVEQLRRLHEKGTVILVPTHTSNLDSIIIGFALYKLGLPPFIYGAGLNLFDNPLVGFFMHNLGAYTVDRNKRDPLYKKVLKEYATLTLEHDYDNIFFPGGTRARSGAIEKKLKLGLLGTGLKAYINNSRRNKPGSNIYIVPATLSFQLVLEAETLIDDFLKEVGKARYIITDDEFSKPKKVLDFFQQLFSLDSKIYFTIGRAFDPFGNEVDDEGNSLDPMGRVFDTRFNVMRNGEFVHDNQRDNEYTRHLGTKLSEAYLKDNVVQATHVTAHAMLNELRKQDPRSDLVRLLRSGGTHEDVDLRTLYVEVDRLLNELRGLQARGGIRLGPVVSKAPADEVVQDAIRHFGSYHSEAAITRRGDRVFPTSRSLIFYYSNRLEGYRMHREGGIGPALTPCHQKLGTERRRS